MSHKVRICLVLIGLFATVTSMAMGHRLPQLFSGYHGYRSHLSLELPGISAKAEHPALILPVFTRCSEICPANLMLVRDILNSYPQALEVIVMALETDDDMTRYLSRVADITNQHPVLLSNQQSDSWQKLARYEQIQRSHDDLPTHAGHLYIYQPTSQTLLTYLSPDKIQIIEDLNQLTQGAKDG